MLLTEISDGWYGYTITKYASAKVLFNDGSSQIPPQNQQGLDAEDIMWYKDGIWCDSKSDRDEDQLPDCYELISGTNVNAAIDGMKIFTIVVCYSTTHSLSFIMMI